MRSRKQARSKPYWKRRTKQQPGYYRQNAFTEIAGEMVPALDENGEQVFRFVPNRALKRKAYKEKV